jgi:hypothetical protein
MLKNSLTDHGIIMAPFFKTLGPREAVMETERSV